MKMKSSYDKQKKNLLIKLRNLQQQYKLYNNK